MFNPPNSEEVMRARMTLAQKEVADIFDRLLVTYHRSEPHLERVKGKLFYDFHLSIQHCLDLAFAQNERRRLYRENKAREQEKTKETK